MRGEELALLFERRRRLLHLTLAGMSVSKAAQVLSGEFCVSERQIWKDWRSKDKWAPVLFKIGNEQKDELIIKFLTHLDEAINEAYRCYLLAKNDNARVGALRLYLDAVVRNVEVRQKLGLLPKGPPKVEERIIMIEGQFCRVTPDGKATPINPSKGHYQWQEDADQQADGTGLPAP